MKVLSEYDTFTAVPMVTYRCFFHGHFHFYATRLFIHIFEMVIVMDNDNALKQILKSVPWRFAFYHIKISRLIDRQNMVVYLSLR